jgi:hypothetical protein
MRCPAGIFSIAWVWGIVPTLCASCAPAAAPAPDLRAAYLAAKDLPDGPDKAAKVDAILREYHARVDEQGGTLEARRPVGLSPRQPWRDARLDADPRL